MPQKNRIFAISKSQSIRQAPTKIPEEPSSLASPLALQRQSPGSRVAAGRSRAGKPELHSFIRVHSCPFVVPNRPSIRVHSWLKTSAARPLQGRSRAGKPELRRQSSPRPRETGERGRGWGGHGVHAIARRLEKVERRAGQDITPVTSLVCVFFRVFA